MTILIKKYLRRPFARQVQIQMLNDKKEDKTPSAYKIQTFYSKKRYEDFLKTGGGIFIDKPVFAEDCKYYKTLKGRLDSSEDGIAKNISLFYIAWHDLKGKLWDIKNSPFLYHISFLWHWKNFFFLLRYPFYKVRNRWDDNFMGYSSTEYHSIPFGWRKAFGKQFSKELKQAIKLDKCRKTFRWEQIKEKWGSLRLYAHGYGKETEHVLEKYELMSNGYCICCGKPARYLTSGWVEYYCEDCYLDYIHKYGDEIDTETIEKYKDQDRLTKEDLIELTHYDYNVIKTETFENKEECLKRQEELYNLDIPDMSYKRIPGEDKWRLEHTQIIKTKVDIKDTYNVDLENLWGLEND